MPGKSKKGGGLEVKSSAYTPYKMKGSPMKRNFGVGSSPAKGLLGKILNPASMLPGKAGEIAGKINPFSKL
tara:strand:- start:330 stop:542 length:213 start_codon:yes stop_codon:yes gene_type:complete